MSATAENAAEIVTECPICYNSIDGKSLYKIRCGSKTPHEICHSCELTSRMLVKPTDHGRPLKCPFCRETEYVYGNRTRSSYLAELGALYKELATSKEHLATLTLYITSSRLAASNASARMRAPYQAARNELDEIQAARFVTPLVPPVPPPGYVAAPVAPVAPFVPEPVPVVAPRSWCQSNRLCTTASKTTRKCGIMGHEHRVCRACNTCVES